MQEIARNLVTLRRELTGSKERLSELEKELRKREQELAVEQEKIKRSEKRLNSSQKQKETNALSREMKLGKKVIGELEEAILNLMNESESLRKTVARQEKDYSGFEAELLEKKSLAAQVGTESKELLEALVAEREEIYVQIDRDYLKRYQTVRKGRGAALAEVENGSCKGCFMVLPPQLNIQALKQEEFLICPNCQRILFVRPENIPEHNKLEA
jgi:predicted  nucleic acid-binding Zn-ribbon protein